MPAPAVVLPAPMVSFGAYLPVPLRGPDAPAYAGPATPTSLDEVDFAPSERAELKAVPALGPMLEKQGFGVVRSGSSLFQAEYEGNIYGGFPVYVTTDAAYNSWHLVFDKTLRDLEQKVLLPKLEQLAPTARARFVRAGTAALPGRLRRARAEGRARAARPSREGPDRRHIARPRSRRSPGVEDRLLVLHASRPLHAHPGSSALFRGHVGSRPGAVLPARDARLPGSRARPGSGSRRRSPSRRARGHCALASDLRPDRVSRRALRRLHPEEIAAAVRKAGGRTRRGEGRRRAGRCAKGADRSAAGLDPHHGHAVRHRRRSCSTSSSFRMSAPRRIRV